MALTSELCAQFMVHFDMILEYGGQTYCKNVKHEQPGTGFWPIIPIIIWHQTLVRIITIWTHKG